MARHRHSIVIAAIALAGLVALSGCGSTSRGAVPTRSLSLPCAPHPEGALCIKVLADGHAVHDVIAYLSASESPLAHRTWRLALSRYSCDPGSEARPNCRPTATYSGRTRHGRPPLQVFCRVNGKKVTAPSGCHDTLASQYASLGDWAGFNPPKKFASRVWLCVSEQVRAGGSWHQPVRPMAPTPPRACVAVSPTSASA